MTMTRRNAFAAFAMFAEVIASTRDADAQTSAMSPRAPIFAKKGSTLTTPVGHGNGIDSV